MNREKLIAGAIAVAVAALAAFVLPPTATAAKQARPLVYVFVLDGLDGDAVESDGDAPYLASLADPKKGSGVYFPRSRSVMVSETNPNHTSMITGAYPKHSGITGNEFATYGADSTKTSCPDGYDAGSGPTATSGQDPACLEAETLFTAIERQRPDRKETTALIMGKPKLAKLFASREVSPNGYDADYIWTPCGSSPEPYCANVPTNPVTGYALNDTLVMDEVIRTTRDGVEDAGGTRVPDFTFANFPQIDSAGHFSGRGTNYDDAVGTADGEIKRFVANQKQLGLWKRTVMFVVSDHSMDTTPQLAKVSIDDVLGLAGIPDSSYEVVGNGGAAHIYLTDRRSPQRFDLLRRMREALSASAGLDDVLYRTNNPEDGGKRHTLAAAAPGWGLGGKRAGDIVVTTKPGVAVLETSAANSFPLNVLSGNHGGTVTRDNYWLVAGGGSLVAHGTKRRIVDNARVAPTVATLLGIKPPRGSETKTVRQAFDIKRLKRLIKSR